MKYIIVDDDKYKAERAEGYIQKVDPEADITKIKCYRDLAFILNGFRQTKENEFDDIILILDWIFPIYEDEAPEVTGDDVIYRIDARNLPIRTIVFTSSKPDFDFSSYRFVIGVIIDDSSLYQLSAFKDLINKAKEVDLNVESN